MPSEAPVSDVAARKERPTFRSRPSVVVMDRHRSAPKISAEAEELLRSFVGGERGGKLRSQLAALHPDSSSVEIEEAIQAACDRFVDRADGISSPGQVYSWIRTTAHRLLNNPKSPLIPAHPRDFRHSCLKWSAFSGAVGDTPKNRSPRCAGASVSGASRTRTGDLLGAIQALCQLSYSPSCVAGRIVPEAAQVQG
jgi:hypothetical protein